MAEVGVVVGVPELVGQRLHAVEGAVEVEQHAAHLALDPHAVGTAHLAGAGLGVQPRLGHRSVHQAGEAR